MDDFGLTPEQIFANRFMEMSTDEFNEWADNASLEEVEHATNLIRAASQQLREQMECLQEEEECARNEMDYVIEQELKHEYFPDAEYVLSKFTLNGMK